MFGLSNTDSNIFYSGDWNVPRIHKYEWTNNRTCTLLASAGTVVIYRIVEIQVLSQQTILE